MAYLLLGRKDQGPYPCFAGEFCGNTFGEDYNAMMEALHESFGNHYRFIGDDRAEVLFYGLTHPLFVAVLVYLPLA